MSGTTLKQLLPHLPWVNELLSCSGTKLCHFSHLKQTSCDGYKEYRQVSNISRTKSQILKDATVFAESLEARCQVENENVDGAAPTGDAPTTSEWSTNTLPTQVRYILEISRYLNSCKPYSRWSLGMGRLIHPTLYWAWDYLSLLGLKLIRVSKLGPMEKHLTFWILREYSDLNIYFIILFVFYWLSWWLPVILSQLGWVTHKCVSNLTIIGSDNGLSSGWCQAIIWTCAGILWIRPSGTSFSDILIEIHVFSFKKTHLKLSSGK